MDKNYLRHAIEKDLVAIDKGLGFEIRILHFDKDRPDHAEARPLRYDCLMTRSKTALFRL